MLKGISPLIPPELLKIMAEMGHDDALVLADANFTAVRIASHRPVVHIPGVRMLDMIRAVTALFPLAEDVASPVGYMQVEHQPDTYRSSLQRIIAAEIQPLIKPHQTLEAIERYAFYERARQSFVIVSTGELQPYGNFILRKGVIGEALEK